MLAMLPLPEAWRIQRLERKRWRERRFWHAKGRERYAEKMAAYRRSERGRAKIAAAVKARYWRNVEKMREAARIRMRLVHARRRANLRQVDDQAVHSAAPRTAPA